ncbi:hypothetical protein PR048_001222 [Dryococelus australis]|uniref:Uncharacterized protein n=1 Tax=Dryococelus australis TaxID=614101 RepID=A0ABQ9IHE5_9NEOP|nr:hypothetical protein PR048_001222 [Dryococelus australis]
MVVCIASRSRQGRVPGVMSALGGLIKWLQTVLSPWLLPPRNGDLSSERSLGRIHRAPDGRFVLVDSSLSGSIGSSTSSSDDGGFLSRRRASWRRPLVGYPSQLSLRSQASGESTLAAFLGRFSPPPPILVPAIYSAPPPLRPAPRLQASSPVTPGWSPSYNFSDLSSVRQTGSSVDRSRPTPPSYVQLQSVHERYSQELPSLRAIHEESWQRHHPLPPPPLFLPPVHPLVAASPPRVRIPQPRPVPWVPDGFPTSSSHARARVTARLLPRHAKHARSAPELSSDLLMETSPSSSSGFGSKNTSSQQNQSSQSGSTSAEWRLPPYRPPPPPPPPHPATIHQLLTRPPPLLGPWLEFAAANFRPPSPPHSEPIKPLDISVDGHYEFDPIFPLTPLGRHPDDRGISDSEVYSTSPFPTRTKRPSKYDNIEARVQAMKEEFHEFRKRQAKRRRSEELESAC